MRTPAHPEEVPLLEVVEPLPLLLPLLEELLLLAAPFFADLAAASFAMAAQAAQPRPLEGAPADGLCSSSSEQDRQRSGALLVIPLQTKMFRY